MMDINDFLDVCKQRTRTQTDSNLARKVGITRAALGAYRKGASFPSDANMLKLARRAKLGVAECLILLNIWRTQGAARDAYVQMLKAHAPESKFIA